MSSIFPNGLDPFVNPVGGDNLDSPPHATQHININDAMSAVQTRVGVTGSTVPATIDFELHNTGSGHNHDGINSRQLSASLIINNSTVSGSTVADALNVLSSSISASAMPGVTSFNGRSGVVVSQSGDYNSTFITNLSNVSGANVTDALNNLSGSITNLGASVTNLSSSITNISNSLNILSSSITNLSASNIFNDSNVSGSTVKDALNNLSGSISSLSSSLSGVLYSITGSNLGGGARVFQSSSADTLYFRTLVATGSLLTISESANTIIFSSSLPVISASYIINDSTVSGSTVTDALNTLSASISGALTFVTGANFGSGAEVFSGVSGSNVLNFRTIKATGSIGVTTVGDTLVLSASDDNSVTSIFGRTGSVVAVVGDYSASFITNDSNVSGSTVKDALNNLSSSIFSPSSSLSGVLYSITGSNLGGGAKVFQSASADTLYFRTLVATGSLVTISESANTITFSSSLPVISASYIVNDSSVSGSNVKEALDNLSGSITALSTSVATNITNLSSSIANLSAPLSGVLFSITGSNLGAGSQVFQSASANTLFFRTLVTTGSGISLSQSANNVVISSSQTTGSNVGGGVEVFSGSATNNPNILVFRTLTTTDSSALTLSQSANSIIISSSFALESAIATGSGGVMPMPELAALHSQTTFASLTTYVGATYLIGRTFQFNRMYVYISTKVAGTASGSFLIYQIPGGSNEGTMTLKATMTPVSISAAGILTLTPSEGMVTLESGYCAILWGRTTAVAFSPSTYQAHSAYDLLNQNIPSGLHPVVFTTNIATTTTPATIDLTSTVSTTASIGDPIIVCRLHKV